MISLFQRVRETPPQSGGSNLQHAAQQLDIFVESGVRRAQFLDLPHRVHDRRVIPPTELSADFGKRA